MEKSNGAKNKKQTNNNQCQRKLEISMPVEVTDFSKPILKLTKYG